jgi:hypothetical protein
MTLTVSDVEQFLNRGQGRKLFALRGEIYVDEQDLCKVLISEALLWKNFSQEKHW